MCIFPVSQFEIPQAAAVTGLLQVVKMMSGDGLSLARGLSIGFL